MHESDQCKKLIVLKHTHKTDSSHTIIKTVKN